jgi:hypothetical protein
MDDVNEARSLHERLRALLEIDGGMSPFELPIGEGLGGIDDDFGNVDRDDDEDNARTLHARLSALLGPNYDDRDSHCQHLGAEEETALTYESESEPEDDTAAACSFEESSDSDHRGEGNEEFEPSDEISPENFEAPPGFGRSLGGAHSSRDLCNLCSPATMEV